MVISYSFENIIWAFNVIRLIMLAKPFESFWLMTMGEILFQLVNMLFLL
jgi:hypothetical protein